jgi:Flp pilus assembly pilin Flp
MNRLASFLRDRRGVAVIDYGMAGAIVTLVSEVAMRHGTELAGLLHSVIG